MTEETTPTAGTIVPELDPVLRQVRDQMAVAFPRMSASAYRGELTLATQPEDLIDVLRYCKDTPEIGCELLSDISAVHWPAGVEEGNSQETTGWPTYTETTEQGTIDLLYILRSVANNLWFRLIVTLPDADSTIDSATAVYSSANFMEREVFDMVGVTFAGHPNHTRVMMPDDWDGHPHRKDYPLGGVEVMYKGHTVAPPDERDY